MKLKEGDKQETEVILQIHKKMDYSNDGQVRTIYKMFKTKQIQSELGKMYVENLQNLVENGVKAPCCSICGEPLQEEEFCICQQCSEKTLEQCKEDGKLWKGKTGRKLSKRVKKIMEIAVILLVTVGLICFGIWYFDRKDDNTFSFSRKEFIGVFEQNLSQYGLSLGEEMTPDQECYQYTILPTSDSLLLFENDRGRIRGIELFLKGKDEESRGRQTLLMSLLNVTLHGDMTIEESGNLISELAKNQGNMNYQDEEWHLMIDDEKVYFLIMKQRDVESAAVSREPELEGAMELSAYMGGQYAELEAVLGESEAVVNESTRYFKEYGVSCIYHTDTGEIVYLDCDADKEKKVSLYGIQVGMTKETAAERLKERGCTGYQENADDWEFAVETESGAYKLTISFVDNKAALICMAKER